MDHKVKFYLENPSFDCKYSRLLAVCPAALAGRMIPYKGIVLNRHDQSFNFNDTTHTVLVKIR